MGRFHVDVARRAIAVEHRLGLRRHGDGARVEIGGVGELSGLVRVIALLLQRRRERLAFLSLRLSKPSLAQGQVDDKAYLGSERLNLFLCQGFAWNECESASKNRRE